MTTRHQIEFFLSASINLNSLTTNLIFLLNFGLNVIFDSSIKLPITKFEKGQVFIHLFLSTTTKSIKSVKFER